MFFYSSNSLDFSSSGTQFSTVYSNDAYGKDGIEQLHKLAAERDMCVDLDIPMDIDFVGDDYRNLALRLYYNSSSNVATPMGMASSTMDPPTS